MLHLGCCSSANSACGWDETWALMKLLCDPCKLVGLLDHASVTWIQVFIIVGKWRIWVSHKILYFNTRVGVLTLINDSLRIFLKKPLGSPHPILFSHVGNGEYTYHWQKLEHLRTYFTPFSMNFTWDGSI